METEEKGATVDPKLVPLAKALLNNFKTREARILNKKETVHVFRGSWLLTWLTEPKRRGLGDTEEENFVVHVPLYENRKEAIKDAQALLDAACFARCQVVKYPKGKEPGDKKMRVVPLENSRNPRFSEEDVYLWKYEGPGLNKLWLVLILFLILAIPLFKVWPIWLRIVVWWISFVMLISMLFLLAARWVSWLVLLPWHYSRGMMLLPNFFDDDRNETVAEAFTPFFGRPRYYYEDGGTGGTPPGKKQREEVKHGRLWLWCCDSLLVSLGICLAIGLGIAFSMGAFSLKHVPEFVASPRQLHEYMPSLAPPVNTTTEEQPLVVEKEKVEEEEEDGGWGLDDEEGL